MPGEKIAVPDGAEWTVQALFCKAIELDSSAAVLWNNLGCALGPGETTGTPGGEVFDARMCFLRCVEMDPEYAMAYVNLAKTVQDGESIELPGGTLTRGDLLAKAQELDPDCVPPP